MKIRRRSVKAARIEMMPLIDIVFLLLVFFIYAMLSMAVHRGLQLDLPESSEATMNRQEKEPIFLSIAHGANGIQININKTAIALNDLSLQLQNVTATKATGGASPGILIFAEEDISYQQLYLVLDELKKGGFTDISLQASSE